MPSSLIQIRIPSETKADFVEVAYAEGKTVSELLRELIEAKIKSYSQARTNEKTAG